MRDRMQDTFDRKLKELIPDGKSRVLAAVSGGADSMCLLHLLCNSALAPEVSVAHMNFCLRGADSLADEAYVEEWCKNNSLRLFTKCVDTMAYSRERGFSIEMAARELRYGWFEKLMEEYGFDYLAVAHHADDNAETLLLNIVRGTGMKGLCGMRQVRGRIIRPLLEFTREEIERYDQENGISYRTDKTNLESDYARNRIRNEVFGQLKKINPSVVRTLNRDMRYFDMGSCILSRLAGEKRRLLEEKPAGKEPALSSGSASDIYWVSRIDISRLLQEEFYPYWLYEMMSPYGFSAAQIDRMAVAAAEVPVKQYWSGSYMAVKERGFIKVYPAEIMREIPPVTVREEEMVSENEGLIAEFRFGKLLVRLSLTDSFPDKAEILRDSPRILYISADRLRFPLLCRPFRPGDRFRPYGMRGRKKVSDYLTDRKVPYAVRSLVPVLLACGNGSDIFCLAGLGISEDYKIDASTRRALKIEVSVP